MITFHVCIIHSYSACIIIIIKYHVLYTRKSSQFFGLYYVKITCMILEPSFLKNYVVEMLIEVIELHPPLGWQTQVSKSVFLVMTVERK